MDLNLTNVINISVAQAGAGVGDYNTSNLALFTIEPYAVSFGTLGYKIYISPNDVATDFGTASKTYAQAVAIFSQQPNILANQGYLVVIPMVEAKQAFALSGIPASGTFTLTYLGNPTAAINWNDSASAIQTKLRAVSGLSSVVVTGSLASQNIVVDFQGVYGALALLTVGGAGLQTSAPAAITITPSTTQVGEVLNDSIVRTQDLVQYFGLFGMRVFSQADMLQAAATVQGLNKIALFVSRTSADVLPGGMIDMLRTGSLTHSRGLFYGSNTDTDALVMMAAYAGRGFSVNFNGSNTTETLHLKVLASVQPDPSMTQTLLNSCKLAGADVYISLQGVSKIFCSGANDFFDNVYNLQWYVGALQVAGFNALAQVATKVPQTENGIAVLKGAYRSVCEQGITNQFLAPGAWDSPTTFGIQADLLLNVSQRGYYIYSLPVAQQLATSRAARSAPLIQIAIKYAGAVHSSSVIVNVNV